MTAVSYTCSAQITGVTVTMFIQAMATGRQNKQKSLRLAREEKKKVCLGLAQTETGLGVSSTK